MATLADRILGAIRYAPLDDDVLARRLGVGHRQSVNQAARNWSRRRPRGIPGGNYPHLIRTWTQPPGCDDPAVHAHAIVELAAGFLDQMSPY